ncbi:NAD(P)-binding protein [Massarina eburnea CBS 473.64]|uniref:NAD(P)-binding protein n=1 Tax=Massarina eburnea CBS 473.64 TaxID=1395130 RepID=A0A6A6S391_9PLEO|nr:NAD(P)-binding protein [Massarina eburnea CBS 473.64]
MAEKLIAITGGTGAQGGGVANIMLKTPGWKVRIITRNVENEKAKALKERGAEVVSANFDDEASLSKAFEGAHAIFAVTNFWEHLFTGKSRDESGVLEAKQALNLARAASKSSTLEHYIWSTLPNAKKITGGKVPCPHFDYKAEVDDKIRSELPELAKKTTFLFFGYYPSNMAFFPMCKPFELPGSYGKYVQILPTPASAHIPVAGDLSINSGVWVRQILAKPSVSKGKYAQVGPETLTFGEMMKIWSEVTGRQGEFLQSSVEDFSRIWGIGGEEMASQLVFGEAVPDWTQDLPFVGMEELGIAKEEVPGLKATLEELKALL